MGLDATRFDISPILKSIELIKNSGVPYEFRTTVAEQLFDGQSIAGAAKLVSNASKYYLQKFVMRDTVPSKTLTSPSDDTMARYLAIAREFVPAAQIRGE